MTDTAKFALPGNDRALTVYTSNSVSRIVVGQHLDIVQEKQTVSFVQGRQQCRVASFQQAPEALSSIKSTERTLRNASQRRVVLRLEDSVQLYCGKCRLLYINYIDLRSKYLSSHPVRDANPLRLEAEQFEVCLIGRAIVFRQLLTYCAMVRIIACFELNLAD